MTNVLDFLSEDERKAVRAKLRVVAPHTTLDAISGDAEAVYGLLAMTRGQSPKGSAFCSIRFPAEFPTAEQFQHSDDGEGLPLCRDPRTLPGYKAP